MSAKLPLLSLACRRARLRTGGGSAAPMRSLRSVGVQEDVLGNELASLWARAGRRLRWRAASRVEPAATVLGSAIFSRLILLASRLPFYGANGTDHGRLAIERCTRWTAALKK